MTQLVGISHDIVDLAHAWLEAVRCFATAGLALVLTAGAASAQQRAARDLSGTWVLNAAKSQFETWPAPKSDTAIYTRDGGVYQVVETTPGDTGAVRITYKWPVGVGEVSSVLPDDDLTVDTRVTQTGDTVKFVSQLRRKGNTMELQVGREYLSADGMTRTREVDFQNLANPDEDPLHLVFVFERR